MPVCGKIRDLPTHKKTPVVVMTGDSNTKNGEHIGRNGWDDVMSKPFNMRELAVKAATWVARQQCGLRN